MGIPPSAAVTGDMAPRSPSPALPSSTDPPDPTTDTSEDASKAGPVEKEVGKESELADDTPRREIKLNRRQLLEGQIRDRPSDARAYLDLAAIHAEGRRYSDAEKVLSTAIQAIGPSLELQVAYEDAQINSAKAKVMIAQQRAQRDKTAEAKGLVGELQDELNRLELDIYQQRCQRYPDNRRDRLQLGVRLRYADNLREAIKAFDEARHDPALAVEAVLEMGECWQKLKQFSKAFQCYQWAIQQSSEADGDHRKRALYRGAVLADATQQKELARQWLSTLVSIDPHYKDAATRLDKLG
jgi:tetratricopeptide (TPR) repeat protein